MERSDYLAMREKYRPENVKLAIIAESPPDSDKYFYKPTGLPTAALVPGSDEAAPGGAHQ